MRQGHHFRHKAGVGGGFTEQRCGMGWTARLSLAVLVLVILGVGALAFYAGTLKPPHHTYEQVLPDDQFPR